MNHQKMIKPMLIGVAALAVLGIAGLPVLSYLPFLIILACPLMMIFMMGSMGHDHSSSGHDHGQAPIGADRREEP